MRNKFFAKCQNFFIILSKVQKGTKRNKIDFIHTGGTNLRDYVRCRCRCDQQNSKQFF